MHNLNNSFNVADEKLGLAKLLDAEGKNYAATVSVCTVSKVLCSIHFWGG